MTLPILPADMLVLLDAGQPATLSYLGAQAPNANVVDAAGTMTQAVAAGVYSLPQPSYAETVLAGGPGLVFAGPGLGIAGTAASWVNQAAFDFKVPFTLVMVMVADSSSTLCEISTDITAAQGALLTTTTGPTLQVRGPAGNLTADAVAGAGWAADGVPRVLIAKCDGVTVSLTANGVVVPLAIAGVAPGVGTIHNPATLGAGHGGANFTSGAAGFFGIVPGRQTTPTEDAQIAAYLAQSWYIPPQGLPKTRNAIGCGDSIMQGGFGTPSFGQRTFDALGSRFGVFSNFGLATAQLLTDVGAILSVLHQWTTEGQPAVVAGMPNIVLIEGGINDFAAAPPVNYPGAITFGDTVAGRMATVVQTATAFLSGVSSGGVLPHLVAVCTIQPGRGGAGIGKTGVRRANEGIRARYASWAAPNVQVSLIDLSRDRVFGENVVAGIVPTLGSLGIGQYLVPPFYAIADNIHPTRPGNLYWGGLNVNRILSLGY